MAFSAPTGHNATQRGLLDPDSPDVEDPGQRKPKYSGFLHKVGGKKKDGKWQLRWFELSRDGRRVEYYRKQKDKKEAGSITLQNVLGCGVDPENKRDFVFFLATVDRVWYMSADCDENLQVWLNKLCKYLNKSARNRRVESFSEELGRDDRKDLETLQKQRKQRERMKKEQSAITSVTTSVHGGSRGRNHTVLSDQSLVTTNDNPKRRDVIASCISELPIDIVDGSIPRMKIPADILESNFDVLMKVLTFADKMRPRRRFFTPWQYDMRKKLRETANKPAPVAYKSREEMFERVSSRDIVKWFKITRHLGEGGYGAVVEAVCKQKSFGLGRVAIKILPIKSESDVVKYLHEVSVLAMLNHKNCCKFYRAFEVGGGPNRNLNDGEFWIVLELMDGGTLKQAALSSVVDSFTEDEIAYVARELLIGIAHLHEHEFAHRDLKNMNVMLTTAGDVKMVDFGLCASLKKGPCRETVGSPFWMAPEMIRGEHHSYPVDIWSFAICMCELANRRPPNCSNVKRAMFKVATVGLPDNGLLHPEKWSLKFKDFLSKCLVMDPIQRATASELLSDPFLELACDREKMVEKLNTIFKGNVLMTAFM